jgi:hypothetical protein
MKKEENKNKNQSMKKGENIIPLSYQTMCENLTPQISNSYFKL